MNKKQTNKNKIIWFLVGNPTHVASSRIHGLNVHKQLLKMGYNSIIAYEPLYVEDNVPIEEKQFKRFSSFIQPNDIVIIQKLKGSNNESFVTFLKALHVKVAFVDCDMPLALSTAGLADITICTSKALSEKYALYNIRSTYIEDCPEYFYEKMDSSNETQLTCYWFGDGRPEKWKDVIRIKEILKKADSEKWKIVTISNHPDADIQWTPDALKYLKVADAIAIPVFDASEEGSVKSANRLLQSMAYSLPVLCSPLRSYDAIVNSGKNAIICKTDEDWKKGFKLLEDKVLREQLGVNAFQTAQAYKIENVIHQWLSVLKLNEDFIIKDVSKYSQLTSSIQKFFFSNLVQRNYFYHNKREKDLNLLIKAVWFHKRASLRSLKNFFLDYAKTK